MQPIPPRQLKDQFNAAAEAEAKRGKVINEARNYESQAINNARAQAGQLKARAEAERSTLVTSVAAEADRFNHLLPQYRANPELFMRQYKSETVNRVMTNAQEKWVIPPGQKRLQIDREPPKLKFIPPKPPEPGHE